MNYMKTLLKGFEQSRVQSLDVGNFYYVLLILTIPSDSIQYLDVCLYDLVNVMKSKVNNVIINTVTREMTYLKYINSEHIRVSLDIHPYEVLADYLFSDEGIETMFQHYRFTYDPHMSHFLTNRSLRSIIGINESYEDNDLIGR